LKCVDNSATNMGTRQELDVCLMDIWDGHEPPNSNPMDFFRKNTDLIYSVVHLFLSDHLHQVALKYRPVVNCNALSHNKVLKKCFFNTNQNYKLRKDESNS